MTADVVDYARRQFALTVDVDGAPKRAHLEGMAERGDRAALEALLEADEEPDSGLYLWFWFCELNQGRGSNGLGLEPIPETEIEKWATNRRRTLEPWEVQTLRQIDAVFLEESRRDVADKR